MNPIPFFDLKRQNADLREALHAVFRRVTRHAGFILGIELETFEKNFAALVGVRFAVGVNSGLDALSLALRALGVGHGHEVIVPANSFIATALAVTSVGSTPVFADADPGSLLIELDSVKRALSKKTKAVIPVHLYGQPVPMDGLMDFCRKKGLFVVEDACQAHGASIGIKNCGALGTLGAFSFYPGKNLGAFGDGGMITTDSPSLNEKLRLLRNYGSVVKYKHPVIGFNTRLDALQAAILDVKLSHLRRWNAQREILARRYDAHLGTLPEIRLLPRRKDHHSAHHLYVVRLDRRKALRDFLALRGIGTGIHYPVPIHRQGAYRGLRQKTDRFPVCEKEAKRVLSLPMFPEMSVQDVDTVCEAIRDFFRKK